MVKIIGQQNNPMDGLANVIAGFGQSVFGDQVGGALRRTELQRVAEEARKLRFGNDQLEGFTTAVREKGFNPQDPIAQSFIIGSGYKPQDAAVLNRLVTATNPNNPIGGETLARSMLGAGDAMSSTPMGFNTDQANNIAMNNARIAQQQREFESKPIEAIKGGQAVFVPQGQATQPGVAPIIRSGQTISVDPKTGQVTLTQGGLGGGAQQMLSSGGTNNLVNQNRSVDETLQRAQRIRNLIGGMPEDMFGPSGAIKATVPSVAQAVQNLAGGMFPGAQDPIAELKNEIGSIQDPTVRQGLAGILNYDPRYAQLGTLNMLAAYSLASALAGQEGRDLSNQDIDRMSKVLGDPLGMLMTRDKYLGQLDTAFNELLAKRGVNTNYLQSGGGAAVQPPALQPPAQQAPTAASAIPEGATAVNPQTGERIIMRNGTWQKL